MTYVTMGGRLSACWLNPRVCTHVCLGEHTRTRGSHLPYARAERPLLLNCTKCRVLHHAAGPEPPSAGRRAGLRFGLPSARPSVQDRP